jgi:hypothetical protein
MRLSNQNGGNAEYVTLSNGVFTLDSQKGGTFNTLEICVDHFSIYVNSVKGYEKMAGWTVVLEGPIPDAVENGPERVQLKFGVFTPKNEFTVAFKTFCKFAKNLEPGTFYTVKTWGVGDNPKQLGSMFHIPDLEAIGTASEVSEMLDDIEATDIYGIFNEFFGDSPAYKNAESIGLNIKFPEIEQPTTNKKKVN